MVKVSFVGWSVKYDEWLPRTSIRLARLNSRSYGLRGKGVVAVSEADQELVVDDADDPPGVWAVRRRGARTSALLVENVTFFGRSHGFTVFLNRINGDPPIPIPIVCRCTRARMHGALASLFGRRARMAAPGRPVVNWSHCGHHVP
jgi:hypothetical protein